MALEKVTPEGSKKILKQWIKTTIEERQKFEHLSDSLRGHVVSLDQQYKECKNLLVDFKLDKRRSQSDLMEKFRALINTKKEKIAKLVKSNCSLQERMEQLETALKEERRKRAVLEGKKVGDAETDPSDIMKQEGLDEDDDKKSTPLSTRGSGRGRGRGRGGGRGRGKFKAADHEYEETEEVLPQVSLPLPHPQDGYGWDEEDTGSRSKHAEGHDDDEEGDERLLRRPPRQPLMSLKRVSSSSSASAPGSGLLTAERESMRHHLDDLSAGALNLIDRVSKVAQIGQPKDIKSGGRDVLSTSSTALSTPQKPVIKREESDRARRLLHRAVERTPDRPETATIAGLQKRHRTNSNSSIVSNSSNGSSRNNSGAESGTAKNKTNVATPPEDSNSSTRSRSRYPVVSMRKARTTKMSVDKNTLDPTPHSMLKSFASTESSLPSPENNKRARLTSSPETTTSKRSAGVRVQLVKNESSIISEEDLYKELE
ncbi:hypothetical protein BGZ58_003894 [Dissophora ornata]|nr:hypothetical protein BGZ58_003894 [Dissophora ornata]